MKEEERKRERDRWVQRQGKIKKKGLERGSCKEKGVAEKEERMNGEER